ncbi:MAG: thiosulfohydrolase SoxB [Methylovulum sp.]|nr:thiosulfohydrolase SoxB [Methylovulum sp.]
MNRRKFLHFLALLGLSPWLMSPVKQRSAAAFGNVTLMHFTDCHAQLLPVYYREPAVNIGVGQAKGLPPHLVGRHFLDFFGIKPDTALAYAFTHLDFAEATGIYGKMGGFAHLATLIKQVKRTRGHENTLLLDGGDSWQGSATALWTKGEDMVAACNLLGVDVMTGHWEFTYGNAQALANIKQFNGEFVAQNIGLTDEAMFAADAETDVVFKPYIIKAFNKARIAIIGQAFPYTPIAHPRRFTPDWQFGIQERHLQAIVAQLQKDEKPDVIVLLSHNGMDVDLKLASRVAGIDVILGGHTHDAMPRPVVVKNTAGKTWVTNAGSHGKFLAVLDMEISKGRLRNLRYQLQPVFANLLEPDAQMQQLIARIREPYLQKLQQPLAVADRLLYRRDNFCGSFDQLLLEALRVATDSQITLSPGFRWGTAVLPGQEITYEDVMNHTAITYPETYTHTLSGRQLKAILEDVADNLFNKDPYYQQGGDMVRVGGMRYRCDPDAEIGARISGLRLAGGELLAADKLYKVSGWAGVGEGLTGKSITDVVCDYLQSKA